MQFWLDLWSNIIGQYILAGVALMALAWIQMVLAVFAGQETRKAFDRLIGFQMATGAYLLLNGIICLAVANHAPQWQVYIMVILVMMAGLWTWLELWWGFQYFNQDKMQVLR